VAGEWNAVELLNSSEPFRIRAEFFEGEGLVLVNGEDARASRGREIPKEHLRWRPAAALRGADTESLPAGGSGAAAALFVAKSILFAAFRTKDKSSS